MVDLTKFSELLEHEVSRKEFLRYVGVGVLGVIGISGLIENVKKSVVVTHKNDAQKSAGYGASAYGR